jgi:hypothetical protein
MERCGGGLASWARGGEAPLVRAAVAGDFDPPAKYKAAPPAATNISRAAAPIQAILVRPTPILAGDFANGGGPSSFNLTR